MFGFFKRRKAQKEQEKQVGVDLPEVSVPKETTESATSLDQPQSLASSVTKPAKPEAKVKNRGHLVEQADLRLRDDIFVQARRTPVSESSDGRDKLLEPSTDALQVSPAILPASPAKDVVQDTPLIVPPATVTEPETQKEKTKEQGEHPHFQPVSTTQEKPSKGSWLSRLRSGLSRTGQSFTSLFVGVKVDEDLFEELETALIMADAGVEATESLLSELRAVVRKEKIAEAEQVKKVLREALTAHLKPLEKDFPLRAANPLVVMIAGVNGAGKTTSIGKLAHAFQQQGASVLLAAGDTFRAAAREQLVEWGNRNNVQVIAQEGGNPGAVAFNAVTAGKSRSVDVVMIDTAGRLPTQLHLMEELKKVKRAITKAEESAPHECLLVVDGNTGQNALAQIKAFDAAVGLTGLVVTKLDGTAKGGILAAVAAGSNGVRPIPVYWIGVGEGMHDLQPFVASEFANALLGD